VPEVDAVPEPAGCGASLSNATSALTTLLLGGAALLLFRKRKAFEA
jgi:LPXTG-motif cell wall-anchored protein